MKKRILFLVNGYGLGNSTRVHAIIQSLGQRYDMDVFAYGNSLKYFQQIHEIQNIFQGSPMEYGIKNGEINFLKTMGKMLKNLQAIYKDRNQIKNILKSRSYALIVSDSNFSPVFLRKRPILISINNSNVILKRASKIKKKGHYIQFLTEWADYLYNSFFPDLIISPFFEICEHTKKIKPTNLIVRKEFQRVPLSVKRHRVLVMTGGAESLNQGLSINHNKDDYDLFVLGGNQIQTSGRARKEPKTFNASHLMNQSTIVVINGGFSSISEALALAKPMIVIPLKGHMEQKINALWIQKNDFGIISSWKNLEDSILYVKKNHGHFKSRLLSYERLHGAEQAASFIIKEIENDPLC